MSHTHNTNHLLCKVNTPQGLPPGVLQMVFQVIFTVGVLLLSGRDLALNNDSLSLARTKSSQYMVVSPMVSTCPPMHTTLSYVYVVLRIYPLRSRLSCSKCISLSCNKNLDPCIFVWQYDEPYGAHSSFSPTEQTVTASTSSSTTILRAGRVHDRQKAYVDGPRPSRHRLFKPLERSTRVLVS